MTAPIKGDTIPETIRRVSGETGTDQGLIEVGLVGHAHRYHVRVDMSGPAPRLVELRLISDDDAAGIDPATLRQVPVRRVTRAAARFISLTERGIYDPGEVTNERYVPDADTSGRRRLDDAHYRRVARLLLWAREIGESSPREYVATQLGKPLLTVDRYIAEAKRRGHLARDWARPSTAPVPAQSA